MTDRISPLAPSAFPALPEITGAVLATNATGVRYRDRDDLLLMTFVPGTTVAGLFTRSTMPGAPVEWCRARIGRGRARALVVNAGNANVFTGRAGAQSTMAIAAAAAAKIGCASDDILLAATGVIGQILPQGKIIDGLGRLMPANWLGAAKAIGTTDTFPKGATASAKIDGATVQIAGIAKGSGMIAPDMATLLAFVVTDAKLPASVLRPMLREANAQSFNCLTVDGDTSTSDTLLLFATGQAGHQPVKRASDPRLKGFRRALTAVMADLARQVACDGEGARKLITVLVQGAANDNAARAIARAIGNSPLVKTAVAGADANWGRIIMAIGKSGVPVNPDKLKIWLGDQLVTYRGGPSPNYDDAKASAHFRGSAVTIRVAVGIGRGEAKVWTCDLTHGYIDVNAAYRT